jgi:hypothetical protein
MNKLSVYKVIAPFRVNRQKELRDQRSSVNVNTFVELIGGSDLRRRAAELLWARLREFSFIEDFKPAIDDDLYYIFGLSPESVRDEVISQIVDALDVPTERIDFTGFSFDAVKTPIDIINFIEKVDVLRDRPAGTKFVQAEA